mgnify:CR=1 FL=1
MMIEFGLIFRMFVRPPGFDPFRFYALNLYGCTLERRADSVSVYMPAPDVYPWFILLF